jgi:ABC-type antimicrobial peptide transport system permease subunit
VQWLVLKLTAQLLLIGVAVGIAAALPLARLTSSLLYGVRPGDELIFAASALLLMAVGAMAGYVPAMRASHLDPVVALRHE